MDSTSSDHFDIFEIYRQYCDIRSGNANVLSLQHYKQGDESHIANCSREALAQLLTLVDTKFKSRFSIFDELFKLMSRLQLMVCYSEFSRFYDFVFFMCRENGQKNITVSNAVAAWKLALAGRFRLLCQWCDFVEKNQRYNISEDTWQQVLAFSRCVHENLEGYDPGGAWPVLIDDFVEHMYRVLGSNQNSNVGCNCDDSEILIGFSNDSRPGLKCLPGLKRKSPDFQDEEMEPSEILNSPSSSKRIKPSSSPRCSPMSPCAVEGSLSKGFAGLFSSNSRLQLGRERRIKL